MKDISLKIVLWENGARSGFFTRKRLELTESWTAEMSARTFNRDGFSPILLTAVASLSQLIRLPWLCTRTYVSSV